MRVRACNSCKEYIIIIPNDPINGDFIKDFEKKHSLHTLVTIDLNEVKGFYKNVGNFNDSY